MTETEVKLTQREQIDLLTEQLQQLREQHEKLSQENQSTQLKLQALMGKAQTADEVINFSRQVVSRLKEERKRGRQYQWRITNRRYKDKNGDPSSFVIWSNARTPAEAVADYKRSARASWDVSEGPDPYGAEPVIEEAPPQKALRR